MPPAGRGKASPRLPDVPGPAETPRGFEGNTAGLLLLDPDYLPLDVMRKRSGSGGGGGEEEEGGGGEEEQKQELDGSWSRSRVSSSLSVPPGKQLLRGPAPQRGPAGRFSPGFFEDLFPPTRPPPPLPIHWST